MTDRQQQLPTYQASAPTNGLATAGLTLGIIGVATGILFPWVFALWSLLSVLAIIFGAIGLSTAKKTGGVGKLAATWGLILGLFGLIVVPPIGFAIMHG